MELSELQKRVDTWIREYGVRYFSELTNMAILTEEVGELARVMARKYGDQSFKAGETDNLADELDAVAVKPDGGLVKFTVKLGAMTDAERRILADGCLINYYKNN